MKGKTPSDPDHLGSFVVLLEPIKSGKIGRAMIQGAVYVQVKIETSDVDEWADIDDGETGQLKATKDGSARIIYRRSGGTNGDWCVCLLGTGKSGPGVGTELQVYMTKLQDGILTGIWDYPRLHG